MDSQLILDAISRIAHVTTAIALLGGSMFMLWVLSPAAAEIPGDAADRLREEITARWRKFVHVGIAVFLASGFYNFFRALPAHRGDGLYHALVGVKILLALGVFFLASALVGRSSGLARFRAHRKAWLTVIVGLGMVIVLISGFAKVRPAPSSAADGGGAAIENSP